MTWLTILPRVRPLSPVTMVAEPQGRGRFRPVVRFRPELDPALSWLAAGDTVDAMLGRGEHTGFLRIERSGLLTLRREGKGLRLTLPMTLKLHGEPEVPEWKAGDGWLEVEMASWCSGADVELLEPVADELAAEEMPAVAPTLAVIAAPEPDPVAVIEPSAEAVPVEPAEPESGEMWTPARVSYFDAHKAKGSPRELQAGLLVLPGAYISVAEVKTRLSLAPSATVERASYNTAFAWAAGRGLATARDGMELDRVNRKRRELGLLPFEIVPSHGKAA